MSSDCYDCSFEKCGPLPATHQDGGAASFAACATAGECSDACSRPDWSCLGHVAWGSSTEPTAPAHFGVAAIDASTAQPLANARITVCSNDSSLCGSPLATNVTDPNGRYEFDVTRYRIDPDGLFAYLQIEATGYLKELLWMSPPPVRGASYIAAVPSDSFRTSLAPLADLNEHGLIAVRQQTCSGETAAGVTLQVLGGTPLAAGEAPPTYKYFHALQLIPTADRTDSTGYAAAFNVKPGTVVVQTKLFSTGDIVSERIVEVRQGWLTYLDLPPTPRVTQ
jgi:hypothetical protein